MSLQPLTSASFVIQLHTWTAILAVIVGVIVLLRRKGNVAHRWTGRAWLVLMLAAVLSSFWIHELRTWGPWSPIHILSLVTLFLLARAYSAIRHRDTARHADLMKTAYFQALLLAGFFTFMPGRIMHDVVFGPSPATSGDTGMPLWIWIVGAVIVVAGGRPAMARLRRLGRARKSPGV